MAVLFPDRGFMVVPVSGGPVAFMTYHEYIDSPQWRERVTIYKEMAGWQCSECGSTEHLTGHHKTYLNIGNEPADDIEVLCWDCHQERHV